MAERAAAGRRGAGGAARRAPPARAKAGGRAAGAVAGLHPRYSAQSHRRARTLQDGDPDILQLAQGSVVELSKFAGEPLEVLVNDKLIARGEVVVVNEKFGIRLTDIISPVERIEQLK